MPKAKILVVREMLDYDEVTKRIVVGDISTWEEVTEDDVLLLKNHSWVFREAIQKAFGYDYSPMVVFQDDVPIPVRLKGIHEFLSAERKKKEKAEVERQKKLKQKKKMSEKKERELFEKLKEKYK